MKEGNIYFAKLGELFYLKLVGKLRLSAYCAIEILTLSEIADKAVEQVIIDLRETTHIDSTTLGLLARIAIVSKNRYDAQATLVYESDMILKNLVAMRFDEIFTIVKEFDFDPSILSEVSVGNESSKDLCENSLRAHKTLIELSEDNRAKFQDVVDLLESDLTQYDDKEH